MTQSRLASMVGVSRATIGRIERGHVHDVTLRTLARVAVALDARLDVRVLWHGEGLDRLLDAAHADLTDAVLRILIDSDWEVSTEVSFDLRGERGVIDILAFHRASGSLLVIEIKSVVPDLGAMLGALDRKARLASRIARERGWHVTSVSRLLVLPDDRTARRRVAQHASIFETALPTRTAAVRCWLKEPIGRLAGVLFLTDVRQASTRHRVGIRQASSVRARRGET